MNWLCFFGFHKFTNWEIVAVDEYGNHYQRKTCAKCNYAEQHRI